MSEKSNTAQYEEDAAYLKEKQAILPYKGDKPCPTHYGQDRICYCCGAGFIGTSTWNAQMKTSGHEGEKVTWNLKQFIATDFIGKDEWPALDKDRMFIRIRGEKKDMLISWEDT